jgi:hypothetical protein
MGALDGFSDADFKLTMNRALRPLVWWKMGWRSAALLAVGAVISGSGLWEWLRLMSAVMERMDAGGNPKPMGLILGGFFLRLGLTIVALYVSLKTLDGSVYALAAGLALGIFTLSFEALRLVKAWTV